MSPKREVDAEACRLLARLVELEARPWPAGRGQYSATLIALSIRCESKAGKAELMRWFERTCGGALVVADERRRECLRDGLHELVARSAGVLLRFRAGLTATRSPNLGSMLVAWVFWRANDLFASLYGRHAARASSWPQGLIEGVGGTASGNPEGMAAGRELWALLDPERPTHRALMMVGLGHSIAEAARRTGCSRQQIYRAREILAVWCSREEPDDGSWAR